MDWSETYKNFALYGFFLTIFFGFILSSRTKHLKASTTSQLAASSKKNYLLLLVGVSSALVLVSFTVYGYLLQETTIPSLFYILYSIAVSSLLLLALFPAVKGWKGTVHFYAAYMMFYLFMVLAGLLYVNSGEAGLYESSWSMNVLGTLFVVLLAIVFTYFHGRERKPQEKLRAQQTFILLFFIALLSRVYLGA